ncbi:conserved hypothetical protein [Paecilomyces variotii No. 5]|uniref:BTB domain-containing protein n=1 Tax=Byssochlamys spectabilis (strain No. 5 / NBRC 109023) TaxID=1356009 RepID=V5I4I0_BYSSN|nr:conserved hypothetical protein [Paecilomyces variotii No. 5]
MSSGTALRKIMEDLLSHGEYSDMKVTCQGVIFNVHRAIVCTQSHFFASAMNSGFEESDTRTVNLPDDDPDTIGRIFAFMYLQDYDDEPLVELKDATESVKVESESSPAPMDNSESESSEDYSSDIERKRIIAHNNILVYVTADKFGIVPLRYLAGKKFASWANSNWGCDAFYDIVQVVMTSSPPHDNYLRDVVVDVISENIISLVRLGSILPLMDAHGTLGSAVMAKLVGNGRIKASKEEQADTLDRLAAKLSGCSCRHCHKPLNVKMERGEYQYAQFRCASLSVICVVLRLHLSEKKVRKKWERTRTV